MKSIDAKVDEDADGLKNSNRAQQSRHPRPPAPSRRSKVASIFFHMFGISNNDAAANMRSVAPATHHRSTTRAENNNGCGRTISPALRYPNIAISEVAAPEKKSTSKFLSVLWKQVAAARKARLLRRISAKGRADDDEAKKKECGGEMELCKRKILMGVKCRPINKSGKLHYGEDGIILPED
uniref:Uncharacterized protein n=1 Tax=Kalanchoe fedtschenkoi TaxID=63787 RepID=A0A7N0TGA8_KALFE